MSEADRATNVSELLVATGNKGKVRELAELLGDLPVTLLTLKDVEAGPEVEETGETFASNAALKAGTYARRTGKLTLADDSGLEIAAIGGQPGVRSARYGGEQASYAEKMKMLLGALELSGGRDRRARFVCAMALAAPDGEIVFECEGICDGRLASEPRGTNGFGYDPMFIPEGHERTFGELSDEEKRNISHRARASGIFMRYFLDFIGV